MKLELDKIYVKTTKGIAEYQGGINFSNGTKKCRCGEQLERIPIGQPYIKQNNGKILVDNINGILFVNHSEPRIEWLCRTCNSC